MERSGQSPRGRGALNLLLASCGGDSPESQVKSARDYLAKGDSSAAVIQLRNALQKAPNNAEARYLLGSILIDRRDPAGAVKELRTALQLGYPAEQVLPALARALIDDGDAKELVRGIRRAQRSATPTPRRRSRRPSATHCSRSGNARRPKRHSTPRSRPSPILPTRSSASQPCGRGAGTSRRRRRSSIASSRSRTHRRRRRCSRPSFCSPKASPMRHAPPSKSCWRRSLIICRLAIGSRHS